MNRAKGITSRLAVIAAVIAFSAVAPAKASEPNWPGGPYNYLVVDQDLRSVLSEFGRHLNVPVAVSENVPSIRLRGKLGAPSARDFLQWVCESYRLVWFYDGAVIHVIPQSEVKNEFFDLGRITAAALWNRLEKAGIADARFPIRPTADERFIAVFGPPAYNAIVRNAVASMNQAAALGRGDAMTAPAAQSPTRTEEPERPSIPQAAAPAPDPAPAAESGSAAEQSAKAEAENEPLRAQPARQEAPSATTLAAIAAAAAAILPIQMPASAAAPAEVLPQTAETSVALALSAPAKLPETAPVPSRGETAFEAPAPIVPEAKPTSPQNTAVESRPPVSEKRLRERLQEQVKDDKKIRQQQKVLVFRGGRS